MGTFRKDFERYKKEILPILKKHDVKKAAFFGSIVKETFNEDSDLDILVELSDDLSLLDFIELKIEIEERIGRKIDLVEYNTIKKQLRDRILKEQVQIL